MPLKRGWLECHRRGYNKASEGHFIEQLLWISVFDHIWSDHCLTTLLLILGGIHNLICNGSAGCARPPDKWWVFDCDGGVSVATERLCRTACYRLMLNFSSDKIIRFTAGDLYRPSISRIPGWSTQGAPPGTSWYFSAIGGETGCFDNLKSRTYSSINCITNNACTAHEWSIVLCHSVDNSAVAHS